MLYAESFIESRAEQQTEYLRSGNRKADSSLGKDAPVNKNMTEGRLPVITRRMNGNHIGFSSERIQDIRQTASPQITPPQISLPTQEPSGLEHDKFQKFLEQKKQ
jgi:hypothetical protein